ncbi:MAG: hypothetical protein UT82_C0008G0003 [Parcubacteria group bacterium GW2011_GWB1_40_14]|nr:MAG: hypothetical protein UT82_C0008G0003 [Parcubacteria group bacterium GW2011_GWB1_40_14]
MAESIQPASANESSEDLAAVSELVLDDSVVEITEKLLSDMAGLTAVMIGKDAEEEEDPSSRTYVAPMAICRPHDFYANVDFAGSVKVSKDRKSAMCRPGNHWIKVVKTKVYGTHGGDLRKISPH